MAVGANVNSLDAAFKQYYADGIEDLTYDDRPFFALMPKHEGWVGADQANRAWHVPLKYALPPAISSTFTVAQNRAASVSSKISAWEVTSKQMYGFIQIDNESIERSKNDVGAFVEIKALEVSGMVQNLSNRLHHYLWGDGTGVIAQIANSTQQPNFATSVITLLNSEDAVKIQPGDELTVAATATGAERAFGTNAHGLYVIGVNMDTGTFIVGNLAGTAVNANDAADGIPTIANNDYVAHRGDRQGTSVNGVISGFQFWIPSYATGIATNDSTYNVNRSGSADWLAGSRIDATSQGIEDALMRASNVVAKKGGKIEEFFLNHKHYSDLVSALSAKGIVNFLDISPSEYPSIGFEGVRIIGAKGSVDVIPDYACPSTLAAGTKLSDWKFGSVGEPVETITSDGLEFLRLTGGDGVECRFKSYSNSVPTAPKNNVNVTIPA